MNATDRQSQWSYIAVYEKIQLISLSYWDTCSALDHGLQQQQWRFREHYESGASAGANQLLQRKLDRHIHNHHDHGIKWGCLIAGPLHGHVGL
jgi:hypothetical protein